MTTPPQPEPEARAKPPRSLHVPGPVTLRNASPELRRPFTTHALQFRILEGRDGKRANCAAYITARTAIDRLNRVCPALWSDHFEEVPGGLRCDLTIDGVTRSDVGWSSGTADAMSFKALYSDAFKRAAVKFGVGVSLYALPAMVLYVNRGHVRTYEKTGRDGKKRLLYFITDDGQVELRDRYMQWLDIHGREHFGEPLDHGHVAGSLDPEEREVPADSEVRQLGEGVGDGEPEGIKLPRAVEDVIRRATEIGHGGYADRGAVEMEVGEQPPSFVENWVVAANAELDAMERLIEGEAADA